MGLSLLQRCPQFPKKKNTLDTILHTFAWIKNVDGWFDGWFDGSDDDPIHQVILWLFRDDRWSNNPTRLQNYSHLLIPHHFDILVDEDRRHSFACRGHVDASSLLFVCLFVCRKLSPKFWKIKKLYIYRSFRNYYFQLLQHGTIQLIFFETEDRWRFLKEQKDAGRVLFVVVWFAAKDNHRSIHCDDEFETWRRNRRNYHHHNHHHFCFRGIIAAIMLLQWAGEIRRMRCHSHALCMMGMYHNMRA